jgi:hypothetical protein
MVMNKPRSFLLLAIFVLGLGCYLIVGGTAIKQDEWPTYLGAACLLLAICVAALVEALQAQHKRIEELERKLSETQSPAESNAASAPARR